MKNYSNIKDDWQFNILGIYNFNKPGSLTKYFNFIKKNHKKIEGDLLEAGVFKGSSLISTAIFLKKIKSQKKIYAFDSWAGFPKKYEEHPKDNKINWKKLYKMKKISKEHFKKIQINYKYLKFLKSKKLNSFNVSTSNNFSGCSIEDLRKKIKFLELDNITLIKGNFDKTMRSSNKINKIFSAIIDVDLYSSYKITLPYIWNLLNKNGMIFLDEYYSLKFPGARIACNEFMKEKNIKPYCLSKKKGDFERWCILKK